MKTTSIALAAAAAVTVACGAHAATLTDFESFSVGSVDGQGGWSATNANFDQEVVDLGGNKALRLSNAFTSGSFGDQTFAPHSGDIAGESGSTHLQSGNPASFNKYIASFDFWSAVPTAEQAGLHVTVSPDDGSGSRQSYLYIDDTPTGLEIGFYDSDANHPVSNPNGGFQYTMAASGLSRDEVHNARFEITFVDGNIIDGDDGEVHGNDIVDLFIDDVLVHSGTTWESYFWTTTEGQTPPSVRAIDTLLFRLSGTAVPGLDGAGLYIDNVSIRGVPEPGSMALAGLAGLFGFAGRRRRVA